MDPHTRATAQHVERETAYLSAINFELNLLRWIDPLIEGFLEGASRTENAPSTSTQIQTVVSYIKIVLELWFQKWEGLLQHQETICGQSVIKYSISTRPVSIRIFSGCVRRSPSHIFHFIVCLHTY